MPRLGPKWSRESLNVWDSAIGFYRIWVIHLGRRYGLIQAMARNQKPVSPPQLSDELRLTEESVRLWCDAAFSVGLLSKKATGYVLPEELIPLLSDEDDVRFMGGLPSYLALRSVDFELFDQYFKAGEVPRVQPHLGEAFKEGTIWDHTAFLKLVLPHEPRLREGLRNGIKVLDIGSGTGGWSIRLAKQFPNSTFVGIDPDSKATSKGMLQVEEFGLKNVNLEVGSAESMKFSGEFDAAYFGEVLCLIASREKVLRS